MLLNGLIKKDFKNTIMKLKDTIHFYLGCECLYEYENGLTGGRDIMSEWHLNEVRIGSITVKPILRKVSDMTIDEANYLADLYSEWAWRKSFEVTSLDFAGSAFITIYYYLEGGPHGIGDGEYTEQLIISNDTIWARGYADRNERKIVLNSHKMTHYLLKQGFDIFNLIESGQAIHEIKLLNSEPNPERSVATKLSSEQNAGKQIR